MIPLHDDNPTTIRPFVTVALIVIATLVFLWQLTLPPAEQERAIYGLGVVPAVVLGEARLSPEVEMVPWALTLVTSMFVHAGFLHLLGNMLYLWIFGNNVEDAMGHPRFVAFYLLCGIAAALAQSAASPESTVPMVGASGAIGGVLGAYVLLYPRAHVLVLLPLGFFSQAVRVPALFVLGFWFVMQFLSGWTVASEAGGVAYWAHIGGFLSGAVLIPLFRRRGVPLLAGPRRGPWR